MEDGSFGNLSSY